MDNHMSALSHPGKQFRELNKSTSHQSNAVVGTKQAAGTRLTTREWSPRLYYVWHDGEFYGRFQLKRLSIPLPIRSSQTVCSFS
jgi:hypothetical protein